MGKFPPRLGYRRADASRGWCVGRLTVVALAALLGVVMVAVGSAQAEATATVEVRVWQNVGNLEDIRISARPAGGSWRTLGTIPLPLDQTTDSGTFAYGDIDLEVALSERAAPATVEVRVWQRVQDLSRVYISARPAGGSWRTLGTIRLLLDDGFSSSGTFQFGDIALDVPLPPTEVSTLAGTPGISGHVDGPGHAARFGWSRSSRWNYILGLAVDPDGNLVVADFSNQAIRRVAPDGTVTTVAGAGRQGLRDGLGTEAWFDGPRDVAVDGQGTIYVVDQWNDRIRAIAPDGTVTTVAGTDQPDYRETVRDGPADQALFAQLRAIAVGPDGDLYIAEYSRVRRLSPSGQVSTYAGGDEGRRDGPRQQAQFRNVTDLATDRAGNVYVLEAGGVGGIETTVRVIDTAGTVRTLVESLPPRDGGLLSHAEGIAVTSNGTVYLANTGLNQIVRVTRNGQVQAVAGTGEAGHTDGLRGEARFQLPRALALSPEGVLFVADQEGTVIRAVDLDLRGLPAGVVPLADFEPLPRLERVVASRLRQSGTFYPATMALAPSGDVIAPNRSGDVILRLSPGGSVSTVAGGGGEGSQDGAASEAQFSEPSDVAVDADGVIYVADSGNNAIRRIATDGTVTTVPVLGSGLRMDRSTRLALDSSGNLYINQGFTDIWRISPDGHLSVVASGLQIQNIADFAVDGTGLLHVLHSVTDYGVVSAVSAFGVISRLYESSSPKYGGALSRTQGGFAVADDGTVYVVDTRLGRVLRISSDGSVVVVVDSSTIPEKPQDVLLTPEGDLLVSVWNRVWKVTLPDE